MFKDSDILHPSGIAQFIRSRISVFLISLGALLIKSLREASFVRDQRVYGFS